MSRSVSQLGQDINVLKVYKEQRNGYFVELGANDGIKISNTYLLEKTYDWTGICVEPIPSAFKKLVLNRPKSICMDSAVYDVSNLSLEFDIAHNANVLSGISANLDKHKAAVDANKTTIMVNTISLTDLLDKYNAPRFIEYMSIDTEGSEYEILKTFNFDKYIFGLIDVEHNGIEPRRTMIRTLLLKNDYIYVGPNKWDDMYRHRSIQC